MRLEQRLSPRRLTGSLSDKVVELLRAIPPLTVSVVTISDPEVLPFTDELEAAIREGGHTGTRNATKLGAEPRHGLEVTSKVDAPAHRDFANALLLAGEQVHFWKVPAWGPWSPDDIDIELYVGFKAN